MELIHDESLDTSASERRSVPGQGNTTGTLLSDEVVSYLCHEYISSLGVMFAGRVSARRSGLLRCCCCRRRLTAVARRVGSHTGCTGDRVGVWAGRQNDGIVAMWKMTGTTALESKVSQGRPGGALGTCF